MNPVTIDGKEGWLEMKVERNISKFDNKSARDLYTGPSVGMGYGRSGVKVGLKLLDTVIFWTLGLHCTGVSRDARQRRQSRRHLALGLGAWGPVLLKRVNRKVLTKCLWNCASHIAVKALAKDASEKPRNLDNL